ncbi:MAG: ORF6N domain-containing protein [Paludibacter sp.]|nr:ORF6N domain-containing protein [Paludibacter sp.]
MTENLQTQSADIQNKIYTVRGLQVMIDTDLAFIYDVETKILNQAVKRNIDRFPENFRFQLTKNEYEACSRSQIVTLNKGEKTNRGQNKKYLPYAFTEQGIAMLSAVLRSETAVRISIQIINAFVEMRKYILNNARLFQRIENVEQKQLETDKLIEQILNALDNNTAKPKHGIFYDGQIFDAYLFIADLIKSAKYSLILIDNYVDETILALLTKRYPTVKATIYTPKINRQLQLDIEKHNNQYEAIEIIEFKQSHDRFLIIDNTIFYHFGASLKDLGKKWFAFSKFEKGAVEMLGKLPAS